MQDAIDACDASLCEELPEACLPASCTALLPEQVQPLLKTLFSHQSGLNLITVRNGCKSQIGQKLGSSCQVLGNWPMARS